MEKSEITNIISVLAGSIDPLLRAKKAEAIDAIVKKMLELVGKL